VVRIQKTWIFKIEFVEELTCEADGNCDDGIRDVIECVRAGLRSSYIDVDLANITYELEE
jgi:hypothetical protein